MIKTEPKDDLIEQTFNKALLPKNTGTRKQYRCRINQFLKMVGKDMDTYFKSKPEYEKDVIAFWEQKQKMGKGEKLMCVNALKIFLKINDKSTKNLDIWDLIKLRVKGESRETIPDAMTPAKLKPILDYADIRTETAILLCTSSGIRIETVVGLEFKDIDLNKSPTQITVRREINKGKKKTIITWCTPEATEKLKEWLRVRDDKSQQYRRSLNFSKNKEFLPNLDTDKRIFPCSADRIRVGFNKACAEAGFNESVTINKKYKTKDGKIKQQKRRKLTYHSLRHYFRSYMENRDLAEFCLGHSDINNRYYSKPINEIAQNYLKHCINLQVFERETDLTEVQEELKEKDGEIGNMKQDIHNLRNQIYEYQEQMNFLSEELKKLQSGSKKP